MNAYDRRRRAAQEAAEWWVLLQGDMTRQQREQYVDWLRESSLHVTEMLLVTQIHNALAKFEHWAQVSTDGSSDDAIVELPTAAALAQSPILEDAPRSFWSRRLTWAAAAMLIAAVGATVWISGSRGQVIQTGHAESREVALADGSMVELDPETRLRVEYQKHARRVFLERGRALFSVAESPRRPFLVEAEGTAIRDIGTTFAVERQTDFIVVTVAKGQVAVLPGFDSVSALFHIHAGSLGRSGQGGQGVAAAPEILLTANQQVTVTRWGKSEPVREVDSDRVLAWAAGRLIFTDDPISDAVQQFNRYNVVQLSVNDAQLARRRFSGVFIARDPASFVAFIQAVAAVQIKRDEAGNLTISGAN